MAGADDGVRLRQLSPEDATFTTAGLNQDISLKTTGAEARLMLETYGNGDGAGVEPDVIIATSGSQADIKVSTDDPTSHVEILSNGAISMGVDSIITPVAGAVQIKSGEVGGTIGDVVVESPDGDITLEAGEDAAAAAARYISLLAGGGGNGGGILIGVDTLPVAAAQDILLKCGDASGDVGIASPAGSVVVLCTTGAFTVTANSWTLSSVTTALLTGPTSVDIVSSAGDVDIDANTDVTIDAGDDVEITAGDQVIIQSADVLLSRHGATGSGLIVFAVPVCEAFIRNQRVNWPATWETAHDQDFLELDGATATAAPSTAQWFFSIPFGTRINQVKIVQRASNVAATLKYSLLQHQVGVDNGEPLILEQTLNPVSSAADGYVMLEYNGAGVANLPIEYTAETTGNAAWDSSVAKALQDDVGDKTTRAVGSSVDDDVWHENRYSLVISVDAGYDLTIKRIEVACWGYGQYP